MFSKWLLCSQHGVLAVVGDDVQLMVTCWVGACVGREREREIEGNDCIWYRKKSRVHCPRRRVREILEMPFITCNLFFAIAYY